MKLKTCPYREDVGDSYCDEQANTEMCLYDGGDCCSLQKEFRPNVHLFCQDCSCLTPNSSFEEHHERKPGAVQLSFINCFFEFLDTRIVFQEFASTVFSPSKITGANTNPTAMASALNLVVAFHVQWL